MSDPYIDPIKRLFYEANAQTVGLLRRCCPESPSESAAIVAEFDLMSLLSILKRVAALTPTTIHEAAGEEGQLEELRKQLEHLRAVLPELHLRLLRERDRLEAERARLNAAEEWNQRSHQTL